MVDVITETLVDKFHVPTEAATSDATFESMDLDSLVLTELMVILQSRFDIEIEEGEFTVEQTVAEAAEVVRAKVSTVAAGETGA